MNSSVTDFFYENKIDQKNFLLKEESKVKICILTSFRRHKYSIPQFGPIRFLENDVNLSLCSFRTLSRLKKRGCWLRNLAILRAKHVSTPQVKICGEL